MDQRALDYIAKNRVCALAVVLPDGTPHNAAVHFSHTDDPLKLYVSTENTSKKCEGLKDGKSAKASVVIGLSEEEWITLQMDGEVQMVKPEELGEIKKIHYAKHPNSKKFENNPETVFLVFTPTWWRYTDYNTHPPTFLTS